MATPNPTITNYVQSLESFYNNLKEKVLKLGDKQVTTSKSQTEILALKKSIFDEIEKREIIISKLKTDTELKSAIQMEFQLILQLKEKFTKYFKDVSYFNYLMQDYLYPLFNREFSKSREFKEILDELSIGTFKKIYR